MESSARLLTEGDKQQRRWGVSGGVVTMVTVTMVRRNACKQQMLDCKPRFRVSRGPVFPVPV